MKDQLQARNARLIRGLNYFESVARHKSLKSAAEELGVSQSAVSHQMRDLTEALGEQLITRAGRGIELTPTGHRLAEKLATLFSGLQSSLDDVIGSGRTTLRLAVCSSFGPGWLIPRLANFFAAHPDIDLQLRLYAQDPEQTDQVADAFVTAQPLKRGFSAIHILDETLVAVCAHDKVGRSALITTDIENGKQGEDWVDYCAEAGLRLSDIQSGSWLQCSHYMLALEMAKAGLGTALVPDFLAQRDIDAGRLKHLNAAQLRTGRRYHLCFKISRAQEREIRALALWIRSDRTAEPLVRLVHKTSK